MRVSFFSINSPLSLSFSVCGGVSSQAVYNKQQAVASKQDKLLASQAAIKVIKCKILSQPTAS